MATKSLIEPPGSTGSPGREELIKQYGCGPVHLAGTEAGLYERHILFDDVVDPAAAGPRQRFEAFASSVRDILSQREQHSRYAAGA